MDVRSIGCWSGCSDIPCIYFYSIYVMLLLFCKRYVLYVSSQLNKLSSEWNVFRQRGELVDTTTDQKHCEWHWPPDAGLEGWDQYVGCEKHKQTVKSLITCWAGGLG